MEIECPDCHGKGCGLCDGSGHFGIVGCPREYVGQGLTLAINFAAMAIKGHWPINGGVLDQSAWFVDLVQTLDDEQNKIDADRSERLYGR